MKKFSFLLLVFLLAGCVGEKPVLPVSEPVFFDEPAEYPIKTHIIKDFVSADDDLDKIPDVKVDIILTESLSFQDFFQLLVVQGVNVVFNLDLDEKIYMPNYSGSLKGLLQIIQESYGLFFKYDNETLTVKKITPVYVKVIMSGIEDRLQNLLKMFGVEGSFYDQLSSRIVFQSDFYTYQRVRDYFYNNPYLTFIVFDVMILEREEFQEKNSGVDWSNLSLALAEYIDTPFTGSLQGDGTGLFQLNFDYKGVSLQSIFHNLLKKENFEVVQSARISTLNGYECVLDVSEKIPYVSAINIGSLGDGEQVVQGFEFNTAVSGLVLNLKPVVSGDLVSVLFDSKIQSLVKYLEVGSSIQTVQQPVMSTRNFSSQVVLKPGVATLVGGLRYEKAGIVDKSLTVFQNAGLTKKEDRTFSISVLLRSELVRYVFKNGRS